MALEAKNRGILELLQQNSRMSVREIAKILDMPPTTIHSRIKKMERDGLITGYTVKLDENKLGVGTKAFVFISLESNVKDIDFGSILVKKLVKYPEIQEVCNLSGDWDVLVKIRVENTEKIGEFVINKIRKIPGVERTVTAIVFGTHKETTNVLL